MSSNEERKDHQGRHDPYAKNVNQPPMPLTSPVPQGGVEDFGHLDAAVNTMLRDGGDQHQQGGAVLPIDGAAGGVSMMGARSVFSAQQQQPRGNNNGFALSSQAVVPVGFNNSGNPSRINRQPGAYPNPSSQGQYNMGGMVNPMMGGYGPGAGPNGPSLLPGDADDVYKRVCEQIEYYLTPENLMNDEYLSQHMSPTGFAPLDLLANFKKVRKLTKDLPVIVASVHRSTKLILRPDWEGRYWAGLYPAVCERSRCTVILLNVPPQTTKEEIQALIPDLKPYHWYRFQSGTVRYLTFLDSNSARQALFSLQTEVKRDFPNVQVRIRTDNIDRGYGDHGEGPTFQDSTMSGGHLLPGGLVMAAASGMQIPGQTQRNQRGGMGPGGFQSNPGRGGMAFPGGNQQAGWGPRPRPTQNQPGNVQGRGGFRPNLRPAKGPTARPPPQERDALESSSDDEQPHVGEGVPLPPRAVIPGHKKKDPQQPVQEPKKYSWADDDLEVGDLPVMALGESGEGARPLCSHDPRASFLPTALAVDESEIEAFKSDSAKDVASMQKSLQRKEKQKKQADKLATPPPYSASPAPGKQRVSKPAVAKNPPKKSEPKQKVAPAPKFKSADFPSLGGDAQRGALAESPAPELSGWAAAVTAKRAQGPDMVAPSDQTGEKQQRKDSILSSSPSAGDTDPHSSSNKATSEDQSSGAQSSRDSPASQDEPANVPLSFADRVRLQSPV